MNSQPWVRPTIRVELLDEWERYPQAHMPAAACGELMRMSAEAEERERARRRARFLVGASLVLAVVIVVGSIA